MWTRYNEFLRRPPELTVAWRDPETQARGWLVINSLRGDAAGGGTRMRLGLERGEVTYLAKTMELKFSVSGPAIGGAKAGIAFDPADPRKHDVLQRWFRAICPYLRECYGTGGDLNVDELTEVIPCVERLGLEHPQEGVVRGHLRPTPERFDAVTEALDRGVKAPVGERGVEGRTLTVADVITGYGVARAVEHHYAGRGRALDGARVVLEGFGNVGASCGLYLARAGARLVAISDAEKSLVAEDGLARTDVETLVARCDRKLLPRDDPRIDTDPARARFWAVPADVFVCAAGSDSLGESTLDTLHAAGVDVIACGANHPFRERHVGDTRVHRAADRQFAVLADFLANCGMARTFSYLMERGAYPGVSAIFDAVDATIRDTLAEVMDRAGSRSRGLLASTLELGLDRIGAG